MMQVMTPSSSEMPNIQNTTNENLDFDSKLDDMPVLDMKQMNEERFDDQPDAPPKLEPENPKKTGFKKAQYYIIKDGKKVIVRPISSKKPVETNVKEVEDSKNEPALSKTFTPIAPKIESNEEYSKKESQGAMANITSSKPLDLNSLLQLQLSSAPPANLVSLSKGILNVPLMVPYPSTSTSPPSGDTPSTSDGPKKRGRKPGSKNFSSNRPTKYKKRAKLSEFGGSEDEQETESKSECKCESFLPVVMRQMERMSNKLDTMQKLIESLTNQEEKERKREMGELKEARNEIRRLQSQIIVQRTNLTLGNKKEATKND